ncbi:MAG: hypothetical protein DI598_10670 [Pseudopedobacter saltans]|uniref:Glycosyl transferase family 2 n=1 Tax=Pseudopedobacter saltans TaxID=151895 RepID=A0A2W5F2I9_9SPHI|nr:MAG: hypothetical protein DI598_10670 [Pseudopedobacter saltans]
MSWIFSNLLNFLISKGRRPKYYVSICAIQKDENDYLEEWIRFHLKIGIDHFFIYDNGSKISPSLILREYTNKGVVTIINYPGDSKQNEAYLHCIKRNKYLSKWIACIDIDEYIVPKIPKGDLKGFLKDFEHYGGFGMNWLIFGSNGHKFKTKKSQLESFVMRSYEDFPVNKHIKSIVQPKFVIDVNSPHHFKFVMGKKCVNENFEIIEGPFSEHSSKKIQLNHYYCRSEEEYLEKISRGYADHIGERLISQYEAHNKDANYVQDDYAFRLYNNR